MDNIEIAKIISKNGGRLYYVGGYVRDKLMKKDPKDIDLCIVNLSPEKFKELFPKSFPKGASFPVFQFQNQEFAFARKENKVGQGHKGFSFNIENITIEDDLKRRDVSINSMAIDVLTNELIDPFNGVNDLNDKILRATSEHFIEDPLRVYRVAQFASRFNFEIDNNTKLLMKSMRNELLTLPAERIFEELKKALKSYKPSIFFNVLKELDLLKIHFEEIYNLIGIIQPIQYHPEGDAYIHSLMVLDEVSKLTNDEKTRFSALLHDIGKALTPKEILPHHYEHDLNGKEPARALCNRLKVPTSWKKLILVTVSEHMRAGLFNKMSVSKKTFFLEKNFNYLKELELIAKVDSRDLTLSFADIGSKMMSEINGNTINLPNNKNAKEILHSNRVSWLKTYLSKTKNS